MVDQRDPGRPAAGQPRLEHVPAKGQALDQALVPSIAADGEAAGHVPIAEGDLDVPRVRAPREVDGHQRRAAADQIRPAGENRDGQPGLPAPRGPGRDGGQAQDEQPGNSDPAQASAYTAAADSHSPPRSGTWPTGLEPNVPR